MCQNIQKPCITPWVLLLINTTNYIMTVKFEFLRPHISASANINATSNVFDINLHIHNIKERLQAVQGYLSFEELPELMIIGHAALCVL